LLDKKESQYNALESSMTSLSSKYEKLQREHDETDYEYRKLANDHQELQYQYHNLKKAYCELKDTPRPAVELSAHIDTVVNRLEIPAEAQKDTAYQPTPEKSPFQCARTSSPNDIVKQQYHQQF
jgi:chromosome segregation ATPase